MKYLGDFPASSVVRGFFNTRKADGTPITLAGTPALAVYKSNSTTESTSGVSAITVDFDSRTGLHLFSIDTSADGTFYSSATDFRVVLTAGTVDSISVVGVEVATFSIDNRSALRPTTPGRTLDVSSGGEAGIDLANVGSPTTTLNLSGTTISTSQQVASVSGAVGSVTGNIGGNVVGSVGSVTAGVSLTSGERTTLAGVLEAAMLNEGDASALLAAIAAKVEQFLINEGDATATLAAIATAVRTNLATELARIDVSVSSRLATSGYTAPDNAGITAIKTVTDKVNSTLQLVSGATYQFTVGALALAPTGSGGGGGGLDAAGVRAAIGLASASLDSQLAAIFGKVDTEVGDVKIVTEKLGAMIEVVSSVNRFKANALSQAPTGSGGSGSINVLPLNFDTTPRVRGNSVEYYYHEQATVSIVISPAIDLTGKTLRLVFELSTQPNIPVADRIVNDADIDRTGATFSFVPPQAVRETVGLWQMTLRDLADDAVLCDGIMAVSYAPWSGVPGNEAGIGTFVIG